MQADAGSAVSQAWQREQCGPRVPMELPAEGYLPSPTCQAGALGAHVGVSRQMLPRPWGFLRGLLGGCAGGGCQPRSCFLSSGRAPTGMRSTKYRLTSQHGPLLLMLLLVAIAACITLIVCHISGVSRGSPWVLGLPWGPGLSSDALYL